MKKCIIATVAAGLVTGGALAGVSTTFDLASAYVFRGVTYNDGAVFQPGIEAAGFMLPEEYGSIAVGTWANYNFSGYNSPDYQFSEVDLYAAYSLPTLVDGMDLFLGYTQYTYGGGADQLDDKEMNFGIGYEISGVALGATVYYGLGGAVDQSLYYELALGYGVELTDELSGSVDARFGFAHFDGGESGFSDYDIGASLAYALSDAWSVGASVAYIGQGEDDVLTDAAHDVSVVGMLSIGCEM
ncbi:TorF family putative porin [Pontiella sp.]|uniref:TorF family putative porin n=1 Tax=Pontiella sp. TaxID=2837462 RepID=UPI0035622729